MKKIKYFRIILAATLCLWAGGLAAQNYTADRQVLIEQHEEAVKAFMAKVSNTIIHDGNRKQLAREYSLLVRNMDALYHYHAPANDRLMAHSRILGKIAMEEILRGHQGCPF